MRISSPTFFPIYFKLFLPTGSISQKRIDALIDMASNRRRFSEALRQASTEENPDGTSRAHLLLERLRDNLDDRFDVEKAKSVILALLDIGDELLDQKNRLRGSFPHGTDESIAIMIYRLAEKIDDESRNSFLMDAVKKARSMACANTLIRNFEEEVGVDARSSMLGAAEVNELRAHWNLRISPGRASA